MERPIVFYQTFPDFPLFNPMYTAKEMTDMGVFKGDKGHYKSHSNHDLLLSNVSGDWSPYLWLDWYEDFSKGRRLLSEDKFQILNWMRYTLYLYDSIIILNPPKIEITDSLKQTLLEVGCNYKFPILHSKWTIQKLSANL